MHIIKSNIYSAKRIDDQLKDRHLEFFFLLRKIEPVTLNIHN